MLYIIVSVGIIIMCVLTWGVDKACEMNDKWEIEDSSYWTDLRS